MAIDDETRIKNVKRVGNAQQTLVKLSSPPNMTPPVASASAPAAPTPPLRALPPPQITVNSAGEAMTNADLMARQNATQGASPSARASLAGSVPPQAATPPPRVDPLDANAGARMRAAAQERLVQARVAEGPLPKPPPAAAPQPAAATGAAPAVKTGPTAAQRAVRFGASPVKPGQPGGSVAGLLSTALLGTAPAIAKRSTDDYERRFGLDPKVDRFIPTELGIRALGALTDVGANLYDMAAYPVNAVGSVFGATPIPSLAETIQRDDNPQAAKAFKESQAGTVQADPSAPKLANGDAQTPAIPNIPTGLGAADPKTWSPEARAALTSTTPGTAVINGRVLSPEEIEDAGNRINVVPDGAFGNTPYGVAYAEMTGKGAPELGTGPTSGGFQGFTAADRQQQLQNILAGPDKRIEQAEAAEQSARQSLVGDIRTAIRNGKRKTAGRLIELLNATRGDGGGGARSGYAGPQRTPSQEALTAAQIDETEAGAEAQRSKAAGEKRIAALQDAIVNAKTPQEAEAASRAIGLLSGKGVDAKTQFIDVPYGDGDKIRLPYNPQTNEIIMPKGLQGIFTDADGNTQQRALQQ